ncbi:MAG TPA: GntR family transcriptional regulator [Gemmataceae bacterium]|jgi:DNA-binding GntR family transcriptional regulator
MTPPDALRQQEEPDALVQRVYDGLYRDIAAGRFRPGERLPRRMIAKRYGVSNTPVSAALVRLVQTGLVEVETGQMARVRRMTLDAIQGDNELREAIETQAIRRACEAATSAEIEELRRLAETVDVWHNDSRRGGCTEGPRLDSDFHKRLAEVSRYPVLVRELEKITLAWHFRRAWLVPVAADEPPQQHGLLVDKIARRDIEGATAEMRAHIRRGLRDECLAFQQRIVRE